MMQLLTRILLLVLALAWCESSAGRVRSVVSRLDTARRVLIIIAHPDDEILMAPLLARRCIHGGADCSFVVMTEGEGSGDPVVRTGEMARAAAMFHARLMQWSHPDVMTDVGASWSNGDRAALVRQLSDVIATERPDMILTFDPGHGSTGHPAHREIGQLVLETGAPNIYLIETQARVIDSGFELSNAAQDRASVWVANDDWGYVARDAEIHASQFTPQQVESLRTLPAEQRRVWLMPVPAP